ncbi:alpha/beta hydrolase [Pseudonocardia sp. NPDC049635]|uniref:alpha/beta fold hydrolase n=1 Tax=Pseudonocardia sp. NPDC049635 TaxID=3155506 RepID=UPI003410B8AE
MEQFLTVNTRATPTRTTDPKEAAMTIDWTRTPVGLESRVLERHGTSLHYWVGGAVDRPAIALLHGAAMDHRMFNAQVPVLLSDHRVLLWDARGHGRSHPLGIDRPTIDDYVDDFVAVLGDAGIGRAVLVGQSMGAYVSQHTVLRHPNRVVALVVIGSTPIASTLTRAEHAAMRFAVHAFALWPIGHLRRSMARATAVREDVRAYALDALSTIAQRDLARIFDAVATAVRREGSPDLRIDVPFLLTHGEHDGTGNIRKDGTRWASSDPQIDYVVIPEAGHNANQDNPEAFNRELQRFLRGV